MSPKEPWGINSPRYGLDVFDDNRCCVQEEDRDNCVKYRRLDKRGGTATSRSSWSWWCRYMDSTNILIFAFHSGMWPRQLCRLGLACMFVFNCMACPFIVGIDSFNSEATIDTTNGGLQSAGDGTIIHRFKTAFPTEPYLENSKTTMDRARVSSPTWSW